MTTEEEANKEITDKVHRTPMEVKRFGQVAIAEGQIAGKSGQVPRSQTVLPPEVRTGQVPRKPVLVPQDLQLPPPKKR